MVTGTLHIISELGGCVVGLLPDDQGIAMSLRAYAQEKDLELLDLLYPESQDLGEWEDMVNLAIEEFRIEGPVLVGNHGGVPTLVGIHKRYGLPVDREAWEDAVTVVRLPV